MAHPGNTFTSPVAHPGNNIESESKPVAHSGNEKPTGVPTVAHPGNKKSTRSGHSQDTLQVNELSKHVSAPVTTVKDSASRQYKRPINKVNTEQNQVLEIGDGKKKKGNIPAKNVYLLLFYNFAS